MQKFSLLGAKRVIADSACSKKDIARIAGVDKNAIDVVYLASGLAVRNVKNNFRVKPYFLYVGDVNWNKNVPGLLQAVAAIPHCELVLVGQALYQ